MSDGQQESVESRRRAVGEWLELASKNARSAVVLAEEEGLETQALYMAQQSMEAAAKGLARGMGRSHEDVRVDGHGLLLTYAKTLKEVIEGTGTAARLDQLLSRYSARGEGYRSLDKIHLLIELSSKPGGGEQSEKTAKKFFEDMLTASPETVDTMLTALEKIYEIVDTEILMIRN